MYSNTSKACASVTSFQKDHNTNILPMIYYRITQKNNLNCLDRLEHF